MIAPRMKSRRVKSPVATCLPKLEKQRGILWNDSLDPRTIYIGSYKKAGWKCETCEHSWSARIASVTLSGNGCPFCARRQLCVDINCKMCFNRSVAACSIDLAERGILWDDSIDPRMISKGSDKKAGWKCAKCKHSWIATIAKVIIHGNGCPFCTCKKLCVDVSCKTCFNRSVAAILDKCVERGILWNDSMDPRTVSKSSDKKASWKCEKCEHSWIASISSVISRGTGCPKCVNKTQALVHSFVLDLLPGVDVHHEWSPVWLDRKRFDIAIPSLQLIIEVDGDQHYVQVSNWTPPHITQASDRWKEKRAAENGFTVFRIRVRDIKAKGSMWKHQLTELLKISAEC